MEYRVIKFKIMKKIFIFYIITSLFFTSCSSPNKIIQNYLTEEIKNDTIKDNVLIEEQINFNEAIRVFQGMKVIPKTNEEFKTIKQIINQYSSETKKSWKKNDFKKINFDIINSDSVDVYFNKRLKSFKNKYFADKFNLFSISKPYFYNKNKFVFFYITKLQTLKYYKYKEVVIMEKQFGKWVIIEKIINQDL